MHELRDKIRKELAGSSSTNPVDTKKLLTLGNVDQVAAALEELLASREINTATSTKGAITTVLCWLTGSGGIPSAPSWRSDPPPFRSSPVRQPEAPPRPKPAQPAPRIQKAAPSQPTKQEKDMRKTGSGSAPGAVNQAISESVIGHPGILEPNLLAHLLVSIPGTTEQKAKKTLSNMIYVTKIRAEGDAPNRKFYPNDKSVAGIKATKAAPAKSKKAAKAKPARVKAPIKADPAPAPNTNAAAPSQLHIALLEDDHIHLRHNDVGIALDQADCARLYRFIVRVHGTEIAA